MKNILTVTGLFLLAQLTFGQVEKQVSDFTILKVYDKIPVKLVQSNSTKVEINGSQAEDVEVSQKNSEVKIKLSGTKIMQGDNVSVTVYYKTLNEIQASQGSRISSDDELSNDKLNLTSNEGSVVKLNLDVNKLDLKTNSGGELHLTGKTDFLSVITNTGGQILAENLKAKNVEVTANAGGHAYVYASDSVEAKTRAGGVIHIHGNPKEKKDKKIAGGMIDYR